MKAAPYSGLTPDRVLDALDSIGLKPDGRLLSLNSYENRVYQAWMDEGPAVVAKFYRPARWSDAQILEEHAFALELAAAEIPVVAPVATAKKTLHAFEGFRFTVFPRRGGRSPELEDPKVLEWIGRFLGRIHAKGATRAFRTRTTLGLESHGTEPRAWLLKSRLVPADLIEAWTSVTAAALDGVRRSFDLAGDVKAIRVHGDCHAGNVLWTEEGPHFVDLDDSCAAPAVQDLWMLMSGDRTTMGRQLADIVAGYEKFREFDPRQLHLIEALRTLRLLHYSAWIARRWEDPAFPAAFPWFGTQRYWQDRILELREQIAAMEEDPLALERRDE